jgi:uncharacterized protein YegJ (DUF2314 family)
VRRAVVALFLLFTAAKAGAAAQGVPNRTVNDQLAAVEASGPEMTAAIRKARATLPEFLALARAPKPSMKQFAVKVGIHVQHGREYVWVRPFRQNGDRFSGQVRNTPRSARRLNYGDTINFTEGDIADWNYIDGGIMKGNFTACALIKREAKQNAEAFKRLYRLDCAP